jgi:hypothetical protein
VTKLVKYIKDHLSKSKEIYVLFKQKEGIRVTMSKKLHRQTKEDVII